ncbi:MAG: O-methyltransferase [Polyangiales bacterium]
MSDETWRKVDDYILSNVIGEDTALRDAVKDSRAAGLPDIAVSASHGKLLHLLAQTLGAQKILEIGTLGGYSTIWLARALGTGGTLTSLEYEPKHAEVARKNLARAGVADRVTIRIGAALDTLPVLAKESAGPFDLTFIDADKQNIPAYFDWARKLSRPGSVIIVDNVVRRGAILDEHTPDTAVQGVRALYAQLRDDRRVSASAVQTVGAKGYDGFLLARVLEV